MFCIQIFLYMFQLFFIFGQQFFRMAVNKCVVFSFYRFFLFPCYVWSYAGSPSRFTAATK